MEKQKIITSDICAGLKYSPKTGIIYRHGTPITTKRADGYVVLYLKNKSYLAHRIAFKMMGIDPFGMCVDHINGKKHDNRWKNLRLVKKRDNATNRQLHRLGRLPGTHINGGRWRAQITISGKARHLGYFDSERDAHKAYLVARENL